MTPAQQPVVPEEMLSAMEEVLRISDRDHDAWHKAKSAIISCRAAMLQGKADGNSPVIPDGYVMVPKEPTEDMIIDGFESTPSRFFSNPVDWEAYEAMSGCQQAAHRAKLCWAAMVAAAQREEVQ